MLAVAPKDDTASWADQLDLLYSQTFGKYDQFTQLQHSNIWPVYRSEGC